MWDPEDDRSPGVINGDGAVPEHLGDPEAAAWGCRFRTAHFEALGWSFAVRTTEPALRDLIDHQLAALRSADAEPDHVYSVIHADDDEATLRVLYADGVRVRYTTDAGLVLERLVWHVNQSVIRRATTDHVLLHSAAVEHRGRGILLVAPAEAGKTTLAAGLVRRGCGYLSDEVAALDPGTGDVLAYPKPLSVDRGSWGVLPELRPALAPPLEQFGRRQWLVPPDDVRLGAAQPRTVPGLVVLPRYAPGAGTRLDEVGRVDALGEVWAQVFVGAPDVRRAFAAVTALLRRCDVVRLTHDTLGRACALVLARSEEGVAAGAAGEENSGG